MPALTGAISCGPESHVLSFLQVAGRAREPSGVAEESTGSAGHRSQDCQNTTRVCIGSFIIICITIVTIVSVAIMVIAVIITAIVAVVVVVVVIISIDTIITSSSRSGSSSSRNLCP